jgi:HlyD family secretion protein
VQEGDSLLEKQIHTGLNDDTHVEVLDGLTASDAVIIRVSQAIVNKGTTSTAPPKSPFMPTRPSTPKRPPANASGARP